MKNNLFKKFLALFLTGTMLAGVGCKDYDDDIDSINKRLDGMDVTISSLPEQLDAIKKSIPDISSLTSKVAALESKLEGVNDLKGQLDKLNGLEASLKQYVSTEIGKATSADALKKTLGNYYATATALTDLEKALENVTKKDGKIDAAVAAALSELRTQDIANLKNNVGNWMGDHMKKYINDNGYNFTKADASSQASADILNQIKTEQSTYWKAIEEIVGKAEISKLGTGVVSSTNLDKSLQELIEKIEPLIARVAELEGRIQSLVFVPSTLEEAQDNVIYFEGASYIQLDANTKYYLGSNEQPSATMTFRVSPAALAAQMTDENVSVLVEKITRAASPAFTVKVQNQDKTTGKFTVIVTTDYKFGEKADETLAIALNVKIASKSEENTYGIDYTSAFIGTDYKNGGDITSKLVIAKVLGAEEGGSYVKVADNGTFRSELEYNSTKTVTFLEGFDVYYNPEGSKYYALADMWANAPTIEKKTATADATASAHAANYTLSKTTAAIKTSTTDLIGDKITSKQFTYNVKANGKTLKIGSANEEISIVGINTNVTAPDVNLMWKYAIAKSDAAAQNVYAADAVALNKVNDKNVLNADLYKMMAGYTKNATLEAGKYVIEITKDGQPVNNISADIQLTSNPTLDSDGQLVKVTLSGDLKESAAYDITASYMHADKTQATIHIKVVVTGMPKLGTAGVYTIPTVSKTYTGILVFDLQKDFANVVWNEALKGAFTDKAEFIAAIYASTATPTKNGKASLSKNGQDIQVTFDNDAAYNTSYKPSIKFVDAKGTGLEVTFKSDVKLIEPTAAMTQNTAYFGADGKAVANTTLSGASFNVVNKPLTGAYSYSGDLVGTTIVYKLDESAADLKVLTDKGLTIPAIDGSNILSWNDWNKLELKVKAELQLNGKTLDTKPFVVKINDPIAPAITVDAAVDATIYASETTKTFQVAKMLKLLAQNDKNVFDSSVATTGLNADLVTALGGEVEYATTNTNPAISVDEKSGVVTLTPDGSLEIVNPINVSVTVNYKYQFGSRSKTVTVVVKGGTKPVVQD